MKFYLFVIEPASTIHFQIVAQELEADVEVHHVWQVLGFWRVAHIHGDVEGYQVIFPLKSR